METVKELFFPNLYFFIFPEQPQTQYLESLKVEEIKQEEHEEDIFMKMFINELNFKHSVSYIKEWTEEEDQLLLDIGKGCTNWRELSKEFVGKPAKVCFRRFNKLMKKENEWPKEDEEMIKRLREDEGKTWVEISSLLKSKTWKIFLEYKPKGIRERYKNFLEIGNIKKKWELEEDIALYQSVLERGRNWKEISASFPSRSCLQLRNRYYKFIEPIEIKIKQELKELQ